MTLASSSRSILISNSGQLKIQWDGYPLVLTLRTLLNAILEKYGPIGARFINVHGLSSSSEMLRIYLCSQWRHCWVCQLQLLTPVVRVFTYTPLRGLCRVRTLGMGQRSSLTALETSSFSGVIISSDIAIHSRGFFTQILASRYTPSRVL